MIGGSYGIGPEQVIAAAIEQRHEAIAGWPKAIAPVRRTSSVVLPGLEERADQALEPGASVLLDDRDLRAGEKFADAVVPVRVTVGKKTSRTEWLTSEIARRAKNTASQTI